MLLAKPAALFLCRMGSLLTSLSNRAKRQNVVPTALMMKPISTSCSVMLSSTTNVLWTDNSAASIQPVHLGTPDYMRQLI